MKLHTGLWLLILWSIQGNAQLENLPINKIQVIGSHNSYKQAIDPALFAVLSKNDSASVSTIDYSHINITEQLNLGLLNLEIDIYADAAGGKYAQPKGMNLAGGQQPYPDSASIMSKPGFKVLHIPDIDFRSNCKTFKECLMQLKTWSAAHENHVPVFITINAKDDAINRPGFTIPEKFTPGVYDELDKELLTFLGKENLLTPDDVREKYPTLEAAALKGNWPTVKAAKGKFIFVLDEGIAKTAMYIQGHSSLKGRLMFVNARPGTPEAAILIRNNPKKDSIAHFVKQGYIVRTRADADTREARQNDYTSFEAACKSGAQIITTDYYRKSTHFPSSYIISFKNGTYFRKNPLF